MKLDDQIAVAADYPYFDTDAQFMLKSAIDAKKRDGVSLRSLAKNLDYRQATVLSHMANGRVAIPIERAVDIARVVGLDPSGFFVAVVAQKAPEARVLLRQSEGERHTLASELSTLAGTSLDEISEEKKRILRDVVDAHDPERRWLSTAELAAVSIIRKLRPDFRSHGLTANDMARIETALSKGS